MNQRLVALNPNWAGLGNRIHFTLSAAGLACTLDRDLYVHWPLGKEFGCPAEELWVNFPGKTATDGDIPGPRNQVELTDWKAVKGEEWRSLHSNTIYIRGYGGLNSPKGALPWGEALRNLKPSSAITQGVAQVWERVPAGQGILGVAIRVAQKSHPETKTHSPLEWYEELLDRFSERYPNAPVYISVDDITVSTMLASRYPQAVLQEKSGAYNSLIGVQEAVIDSYMLAACTYMLTPYKSSFPLMARQLSGDSVALRDSLTIRPSLREDVFTVASNPLRPYEDRRPVTGWGTLEECLLQ